MSKPWQSVERLESPDGILELRRRDEDDFLICIDGRVLMNSRASRSEEELGWRTCAGLRRGARILVGGLGMGLTLRAVLDSVDATSRVTVAELHPVIEAWCRGPMAALSGSAAADPRVTIRIGDVADRIREAAEGATSYDAIVLDLFEGPHSGDDAADDPLYGRQALRRSRLALARGGVLGVWSEAPDKKFEARLRSEGFAVESIRPGRGGLRHWVVLARRA